MRHEKQTESAEQQQQKGIEQTEAKPNIDDEDDDRVKIK